MLEQMHGTRIPLEIVELDTGTQLTDQQIINSEYHIVHDAYDTLNSDDITIEHHGDDKIAAAIRDAFHINRKPGDVAAKGGSDPRVFYQTGVSFYEIFMPFSS